METIRGKTSQRLDINELKTQLENYNRVLLDLGTGDGRYVRTLANNHPDWFMVGVDACRENLREHSRAKLPNQLFVIACAQELPPELTGLFSHITINFPWGSLLEGLLACDPGLMHALCSVSRPGTEIDIHLNGGALAQAGMTLETGAQAVYENVSRQDWCFNIPSPIDHAGLRNFPSTWAKRLAYGRDPHAVRLTGRRI